MEFSVKKYDLLQELSLTQGVVERKTTIPILGNILCEAAGNQVTLTATDLELSIRTSCEAKVKKEGAGTIPAKKLLELVRLLPEGEIRFKLLENHWVQILADRKTYKMVGMAKDNFPAIPAFPASSGEDSGENFVFADRQDGICDFQRRIALHAEWRAAAAEAGHDHHGGHRRPSPGRGGDRSQIRGPDAGSAPAGPEKSADRSAAPGEPRPAKTARSNSRWTTAIYFSASASAC